ncbi:protein phosphatase 2C domain-containing protein [Streptomyces virginiae]|uniref:protein phosphatase 2C domain-containing protein n=1 Tax=Streptomyces virginiae TaxID=1961 RepID=UPI00224F9BB5|nr:protein phosphatase 2C domain-containing protein [Streptomyces virginiae]MCX4716765.1 protein phosphatase 2C domain-containing protein [Streptomyces virginiae]MCX5274517.1 protein phosphatase 2C domain-containing protein [Streptomyces virginiae]
MSQQGADDWWQKLYEGPDAGAEPDPGDTLDNRFRSAAGVTTEPAPATAPPTAPAVASGTAPATGPAPDLAPDPGPPEPPRAPEPLLPGPRQGEPVPTPTMPGLPPPRDPRAGGATGYALGGVDVPPVRGPELPVRHPEAPSPEAWFDPAPRQAPVAEPEREPDPEAGPEAEPGERAEQGPGPAAAGPEAVRPAVSHLGDRAPTYAPEPGALPPADPAALDALTPDTVLEGARYGTYTLRAASLRGDSARYRGEARRDFLLTARFGSGDDALILVALAGGDRAAPGAAEAAAELCRTVASAVGRSQDRLAEDIRAGHRDALRSGLQRLTDRGYGRLRARAAELGLAESAYTAGLRGLLLPVDPQCRTRVCFGAGAGGLFRLRSGRWQDLEPAGSAEDKDGSDGTEGGFRFRAAVARPGDTLLLCSGGLAEPMREEAALPAELAARWADQEPPGLAAFLADTQLRLKGYADDRTAAAVWEG